MEEVTHTTSPHAYSGGEGVPTPLGRRIARGMRMVEELNVAVPLRPGMLHQGLEQQRSGLCVCVCVCARARAPASPVCRA
jgi:hypothetical protein